MTIVAEVENGLISGLVDQIQRAWGLYNAPINRKGSVFYINVALN